MRKADIPGARLIRGDISKLDEVVPVLTGHRWDVVADWIAFTEKDVIRDIELFRQKTEQYVFISSASVYQKPLSYPIITESTPLCNPFWEYSRNKIACEERLNRAYREESFPITIVRPSHTYDKHIPVAIGGGREYTIVDRMKKGEKVIVHGDGTSLWTVTHAEDFAKGFVGLLGHQQAIGHAFHITSDEVLTWDQIHQAIADAVGVKANVVHIPTDFIVRFEESLRGTLLGDKSVNAIFDNTKIKRFVPNYVATIPFNEGVKRTIAWFEADPARQLVLRETNDMVDRLIRAYEG
jgi:nucleoside-diphosphate-sugar epimerase